VVVREGVTLDPEALIRFLTPLIPANMVPLFVEIVAEFPKTETMKVKKFQLKNMGNNDRTWDREAVEA
jgi:crotonobetaine/carnitine-CoA ligase